MTMTTASSPPKPEHKPEASENPGIPEGFTLHTENSARILLPATDEAFLNPVQEINRDLSVACIRIWGDLREKEREGKWRQKLARESNGKGGKGAKKRKSECLLKVCY